MDVIRIGTRGSKLALAQTHLTIDAIKKAQPDVQVEIVTIETTGDKSQKDNLNLQKIGGKGLFAAALNEAMERGEVDLLVHSMKDLPSIRPDKYTIAAMLPRGDVRDSFLSNIPGVARIEDLPPGAIVGTASPRRAAITKRKRPDLVTINFRGNVPTRVEKLNNRFEGVSATFLARVGLERLGMGDVPQTVLDPNEFLPAAGQAAIGIEVMSDNTKLIELLKSINCEKTYRAVTAERACLAVLDGDCKTSISAYATEEGGIMTLRAELYTTDGNGMYAVKVSGPVETSPALGKKAGTDLLSQVPKEQYGRYNIIVPA